MAEAGFLDGQRRVLTLMVSLGFFCWSGYHFVSTFFFYVASTTSTTSTHGGFGFGYSMFFTLLSFYYMVFAFFTAVQMTEGETGLGQFKGFVNKVCPMYSRHGRRAVLYAIWVSLYTCSIYTMSTFSFLAWIAGGYDWGYWITLVISSLFTLAWWFIIVIEIVNFVQKGEHKETDEAGNKTENV